jgi:hypothetical protein
MNWTVVWQPAAEGRLAELWNGGPDRAAITAAANAIDRMLARDPLAAGEARTGAVRILIQPPLAVEFTVSEPDRLVSVYAVWRWGSSP